MTNNAEKKGTLFIISAPSGAGKTTLVKALTGSVPGLSVSISHTTRAPRPGENHGIDYYFVSDQEFKQLEQSDAFLESAEVFGNFYGTARESVFQRLSEGLDIILEIDWQGAERVKALWPEELVSIFILPPSRTSLAARLRGRKQDSDTVIEERLAKAVSEMQHYSLYDYLIINDDFGTALHELQGVIDAARHRTVRQKSWQSALLQELLG